MGAKEVQVLKATKMIPNSRGRNAYAVKLDRIRVAAYCRVSTVHGKPRVP